MSNALPALVTILRVYACSDYVAHTQFVGLGEHASKSPGGFIYVPVHIYSPLFGGVRKYGTTPTMASLGKQQISKKQLNFNMRMPWGKVANRMQVPVCSGSDITCTICS